MPRVRDNEFITFNDGTLSILHASNRKITGTAIESIRFGRQTVGIKRFWQAKVASSTVDVLVAIPQIGDISISDICVINGQQYKILQIQDKFDQSPPCHFLSLARNPIPYEDKGAVE